MVSLQDNNADLLEPLYQQTLVKGRDLGKDMQAKKLKEINMQLRNKLRQLNQIL